MFANVILPDVPVDQMRGLMALLSLIASPEAKASADFLAKLSAEKDAAVATLTQVAIERAEIERRGTALAALEAREIAVSQRETQLAAAQADLDRRTAAFNARMAAVAAAVNSMPKV